MRPPPSPLASPADATADLPADFGADVAVAAYPARSRAADLRELTKPGISAFLVVTAAAGYLLGAPDVVGWATLLGLMLGTALTAGGSGALNHAAERARDARMKRTEARPVPMGRISPAGATVYGLALVAAGLAVLAVTTNGLTVGLAAVTVILYILVYTPLKTRTPLNTLVGAVPGGLPALGGFAAAADTIAPVGWAAFGVVALWQLPHFLALAWLYRDDYARGGYRMLPSEDPSGRLTGSVMAISALALVLVGMLPTALGAAGWLYCIGMLALGAAFTITAFSFAAGPTDARARRVLVASFVYVPAFFALVLIDWILR